MTKTTDKVVLLGARKSVVAIATRTTAAAPSDLPAVVILNSGIIHRVGHNRMYVALARELAAMGHHVLRIDLSGIGDSDARPDIVDPLASSLADIKDAIDWLCSSRGATRVVLLGLCSGANQSIVYAGSDPRIVGVVLLDPSIPRTRRFYLHFLGSRMKRGASWTKLMLGRGKFWNFIARLAPRPAQEESEAQQPSLEDPAVRTFLENAYRRSVQNGNQLLAVFTAGVDDQHNYRGQLLDAMPRVPFGKQLRLEYFARCDHTFTFPEDRRRLFETVKGWLASAPFITRGEGASAQG